MHFIATIGSPALCMYVNVVSYTKLNCDVEKLMRALVA